MSNADIRIGSFVEIIPSAYFEDEIANCCGWVTAVELHDCWVELKGTGQEILITRRRLRPAR